MNYRILKMSKRQIQFGITIQLTQNRMQSVRSTITVFTQIQYWIKLKLLIVFGQTVSFRIPFESLQLNVKDERQAKEFEFLDRFSFASIIAITISKTVWRNYELIWPNFVCVILEF